MRKADRSRLSVVSKENWHLPTLVAGVMHNIEPAHHALQQVWGGRGRVNGLAGEEEKK